MEPLHRSFTDLTKKLTEQATTELGLPILKTAIALRVGQHCRIAVRHEATKTGKTYSAITQTFKQQCTCQHHQCFVEKYRLMRYTNMKIPPNRPTSLENPATKALDVALIFTPHWGQVSAWY